MDQPNEGAGTGGPPLRDLTPARLPLHDGLPRPSLPTGTWAAADLRRKLLWVSSMRLVSLLVLVVATALFSADGAASFLEVVRDSLMWVGIVFVVPAALYFPALFGLAGRRWLGALAYAGIAQDCLFSAMMVAVTGGSGSAFTFFFSLGIVVAGVVIGRSGTLLAVLLSWLLLVGIALFEVGAVVTPPLLQEFIVPASLNSVLYSVGMNVVAFVSIGFLSSYLSEQLRRSDIQRERYRTNLEDLRQLHESILSSVETGIVTCRLDQRILHVNRAAEDLLGIEMNRAKGRNLFDMVPELKAPMSQFRAEFEIVRMWGGVPRYLRVSVTPLLARLGEMIGRILVVDDVSPLKQLEAQMKADERLATIGKLSAVVAHEIRNPLAAISASAQMLGMAKGLGSEDRRALDIVVHEADRLNAWITELLDYARPRKGEPVGVDLSEVLGQVVELMRGDPASARVEILVDVEPGLKVRGTPERLHRVFVNLAKNSLEAMTEGGTLEVRARSEGPFGEEQRRWAVVRLVDNGCGIPAEEIGRIFDAFYTTKPRGTGLGLATVAQVVEEFGGTVGVVSVPYVRTEFEVRLPMG